MTKEEVRNSTVRMSKAPGQDGVTIELLVAGSENITTWLTKTINLSLKGGIVPKDWCKAVIVSLHKNGDITTRAAACIQSTSQNCTNENTQCRFLNTICRFQNF